MDWGPYDFTTLHHVLKPRAVEVLAAFAATPVTAARRFRRRGPHHAAA